MRWSVTAVSTPDVNKRYVMAESFHEDAPWGEVLVDNVAILAELQTITVRSHAGSVDALVPRKLKSMAVSRLANPACADE